MSGPTFLLQGPLTTVQCGATRLAMVKRYSHFDASHTQTVVERMAQQFLASDQPQEGAPDVQL